MFPPLSEPELEPAFLSKMAVKLLPNVKLQRATAVRQNWRLPPRRMDAAV